MSNRHTIVRYYDPEIPYEVRIEGEILTVRELLTGVFAISHKVLITFKDHGLVTLEDAETRVLYEAFMSEWTVVFDPKPEDL